jgi:uncharacterized membrane protein YadS
MPIHNDGIPVELTVATVVFLAMAAFLVNVMFAIGITRDGDRIREKGGETMFVGPNGWALGVLVGSFLVVALYWLVHHSSLRVRADENVR